MGSPMGAAAGERKREGGERGARHVDVDCGADSWRAGRAQEKSGGPTIKSLLFCSVCARQKFVRRNGFAIGPTPQHPSRFNRARFAERGGRKGAPVCVYARFPESFAQVLAKPMKSLIAYLVFARVSQGFRKGPHKGFTRALQGFTRPAQGREGLSFLQKCIESTIYTFRNRYLEEAGRNARLTPARTAAPGRSTPAPPRTAPPAPPGGPRGRAASPPGG